MNETNESAILVQKVRRHLAPLCLVVCADHILSVCALQQDEGLIARRPFRYIYTYTHMCSPSHKKCTGPVVYEVCCATSKQIRSAGAFSKCMRAFTLCCICAAVHSPLWCTRRDDLIVLILRRTRGPMCGILQADYAECKQHKLLLWKSDTEGFFLGK
jgi:hypothetical protein